MASRRLNVARQRKGVLAQAVLHSAEVAFRNRAALAEWLGIERSQITRAAAGQSIGGAAGWRMKGLAAVVTALLDVYDPEVVPDWLAGINPHLNDRRPLDVLAQGDVASVMAALQAEQAGSFA
jgi:uncharacterized protein (DUF2384 family)